MKVKEFMKKVNVGTAQMDVYMQEGAFGEIRKALSTDFGDYYYKEADKTVMSISLRADGLIVHYK